MEQPWLALLIVCPLVFFAGLVDAVAGGGGLISLPAYLAAGLPPHAAVATNKCSSTFGTLFSTLRFMKNKRVHYVTAAVSAATALAGSYLGAELNMRLDEKYLSYFLLGALPVIAVFMMVKKDFGREEASRELSVVLTVLLSSLAGLVMGIYDGFFGPGTGTFLILIFTAVLGFDLTYASGTAKVVNLASNVAAFVTFAAAGNILWFIGLPAAAFGTLGNWIGTGLALKRGGRIIRPMFFVVLVLLFLHIIYTLFFA